MSIAGVPFDSVRRFRATLLLRTTCMRLCGNWVASCVVAYRTKNQEPSPPVAVKASEMILACGLQTKKKNPSVCVPGILVYREKPKKQKRLEGN